MSTIHLAFARSFVKSPIDSEGYIWSARWDGWKVSRYTPDGALDRVIEMPVARPTSCFFGGPELDELFITSARVGFDEPALAIQPQAGDLFRIKTGVRGQVANMFKG